MAQLNVSVPAGLKNWIDSRVGEGRYSSPSDYIRSLIRDDQDEARMLVDLQAAIDEGLASPVCEGDAREILAEIIRERREKHSHARAA